MPPVVMVPDTSSRQAASAAIIARALSLTLDGLCPSAQLIVLSAFALLAAVRDHDQNAIGFLQRKRGRARRPLW